jgi:hypothetical protein
MSWLRDVDAPDSWALGVADALPMEMSVGMAVQTFGDRLVGGRVTWGRGGPYEVVAVNESEVDFRAGSTRYFVREYETITVVSLGPAVAEVEAGALAPQDAIDALFGKAAPGESIEEIAEREGVTPTQVLSRLRFDTDEEALTKRLVTDVDRMLVIPAGEIAPVGARENGPGIEPGGLLEPRRPRTHACPVDLEDLLCADADE